MDTRTLIRLVVIGYFIAPTLSVGAEISGTPFTVTDTGHVISGYRPAQDLRDSLDADKVGASR